LFGQVSRDAVESKGFNVAHHDHHCQDPCRCELIKLAFEGLAYPAISLEHILDRLLEPEGRALAASQDHTMTRGTRT